MGPSSSSSAAPAEIFEVTTSLRNDLLLKTMATEAHVYDVSTPSQFYMLSRHRDRMLAAAKAFDWSETSRKKTADLEVHIRAHLVSEYGDEEFGDPLKVRVTLSSDGILNVTSTKVAAVLYHTLFPKSFSDLISISNVGYFPTFRIYVSPVPVVASPFTRYKTTNRTHYDGVRFKTMPLVRHRGDDLDHLPIEILLTNSSGEIMEGTFTTPYFKRGGLWVTPCAECGGNLGTTRQYALDQSLCREGVVERASIVTGEKVVLSNGVRGFGWGIVEEP